MSFSFGAQLTSPRASAPDGEAIPLAGSFGGAVAPVTDYPVPEEVAICHEFVHFQQLVEELRHVHVHELNLRARPIGVALSGGGTRAAAFHCGVLWSLATSGLLKEVQHLCAVSGGGYTAASYVTHVCGMDPPAPGQSVDAWYCQVISQLVLRMQHNISYLVATTPSRFFHFARDHLPEERGSSCCPRILDIFLFLGALFASMTASPILLCLQTLWPFVISVEIWHGAMLRSAWCDPNSMPNVNPALTAWVWNAIGFIVCLAAAALFLALLAKTDPCTSSNRRNIFYLIIRSGRHVIERWAIIYGVYVLLVLFVLLYQVQNWGSANTPGDEGDWIRSLCHHYIAGHGFDSDCVDQATDHWQAWFRSPALSMYSNETWVAMSATRPKASPSWDFGRPLTALDNPWHADKVLNIFTTPLGACGSALVAISLIIWRESMLKWVFTVVGPLLYFAVVAHVARWTVFGRITMQSLLLWSWNMPFTPYTGKVFFLICAIGALLTLPVYDAIQKLAHLYYRRALKRAFFYAGQDLSCQRISSNPYCPNLLFGACVHDYRKPWEAPNHSDFTISSLFLGCNRTGFFGTPGHASLARLMTIAGAATDATFLLTLDVPAIRFFLAVVSLRFGDFLRLEPAGKLSLRVEGKIRGAVDRGLVAVDRSLEQANAAASGVGRRLAERFHEQHWISLWLQGLFDRLPAATPFVLGHTLLLVGNLMGYAAEGAPDCKAWWSWVHTSFVCFSIVAALSFFAYLRPLQWLMRSPMIQQLMLLCMHRYKAEQPPPYLYISDGGLIEVLGIVPLLRRRLARILASDAADDPQLSMRVLRDAFHFCRQEGLCSFYDPRDPRRDMEFLLQDFCRSGSSFLHLGIRYESSSEHPASHGELFYVRMRLLPDDDTPVRGLLTETELLRPPSCAAAAPAHVGPHQGLRRELGGTCCPIGECGGFCAGRRFPHFGMSNQFLTPVHFANLCNLGAELSSPLIEAMLQRSWDSVA